MFGHNAKAMEAPNSDNIDLNTCIRSLTMNLAFSLQPLVKWLTTVTTRYVEYSN